MKSVNTISVAVLPGDGIGKEVMEPCIECLDLLSRLIGGFAFHYDFIEAGAGVYAQTGTALPEEAVKRAGGADVMLLGAMGLPHIRYPDGREIAPQIDLREIFELYAGVRPVRTFAGLPVPLKDPRSQALDFVLIRESTEGLFASRGKAEMIDGREARETLVITRLASERLFKFAFNLARKRRETRGTPGKVTCVDKANVFGSFAFFRNIFEDTARSFDDISAEARHVDAMAMLLVRNPWEFDVLVTENMFGDILSDEAAALMGGLGMAPSGDIGDRHALFQPCHGTAPDIIGTGKANPTAMFLSAALMLEHLAAEHSDKNLAEAARLLEGAVMKAYGGGDLRPFETGGGHGLKEISERVLNGLQTGR